MTSRSDAPENATHSAISDTDLRGLFDLLPSPYVMLAPDLSIVSVNDAYLRVTMTRRDEILGRHLFEVFPDKPGDPQAGGERDLRASLARATREHGTDVMPILRHDMRLPGGEYVEKFWSPSITTMWRPGEELAYIVLHIEDVTEYVQATRGGIELAQSTQEAQARYEQTKLQSQARERMLLGRIAADRERLQEVVKAKDDFLEIVSHELGGPMTIIRGNAAILLRPESPLDDEGRRSALLDIVKEGARVSRILDNLLILGRPELDATALVEPCNLVRVCEQATRDHRRQFPERSPFVQAANKELIINCVETYLGQVLQNLLNNAEKYSPPDEPIVVRIERKGREAHIAVLDAGKGFTPEQSAHVFEPFFRVKDERSQRPGLGIGLAVCKRLVEVMGGSIWAKTREGGGAEVGFSLPLDETPGDG